MTDSAKDAKPGAWNSLEICKLMGGSGRLTQTQAARRLAITQPRLNDLLRGRINKFSLDTLVGLADRAGIRLRLHIDRAA